MSESHLVDPSPAPPLAHPDSLRPDPRLYVIDDDRGVLDVIDRFARPHGFEILTFEHPPDAMAAMSERPPDVALVDLRMPGTDGIEMLRAIKQRAPLCEVVLMTGYGTIETAVEAIKLGAADYLSKPFDFPRLREMLSALRAESVRRQAVEALEADLARQARFHDMTGRSPAMLDLFSMIRRVGPHFTTVLVSGETGAGKERVARALHATSRRRDRPFVTLNCAALVEQWFETELFGTPAGAPGGESLFARASAGVLFLDDVGELAPAVQAKLLRVLETGLPAGAAANDQARPDLRIVAATSRALDREVQAGRFRSDLYFRLHVVELRVPPLRERREDIPLLARQFAQEYAASFEKPLRGLTPDAERALAAHDWPGNVRELRNVIGRAAMLVEREWIDAPDLSLSAGVLMAAASGPVRPMQEVEREQVVRALDETRGNKKEAARRLGISRRAFYRRLEKYGLYSPQVGEIEDSAA